MATTDQIKRLVQAHYAGNEEAFRTCVLQIAAYEAKRGHSNIAAEIKELLNTEGAKRTRIINLAHQDGLFGVEIPSTPLDAVVLSDSSAERVGRVLTEYRNRKTLANHGFSNRRKILLEGLPGTGKTMTASAIATELELPLYTVQVDKLITKYMGETSARLRQIFDAIANTSGVFFFDEFDAIGADRNLDNDVGEMRRILNSFLQFIESDKTQNIIIAATNNAKLLDPALFSALMTSCITSCPVLERSRGLWCKPSELPLKRLVLLRRLMQSWRTTARPTSLGFVGMPLKTRFFSEPTSTMGLFRLISSRGKSVA